MFYPLLELLPHILFVLGLSSLDPLKIPVQCAPFYEFFSVPQSVDIIFCASGVSTGLATRVTVTLVSLGRLGGVLRGGGPASDQNFCTVVRDCRGLRFKWCTMHLLFVCPQLILLLIGTLIIVKHFLDSTSWKQYRRHMCAPALFFLLQPVIFSSLLSVQPTWDVLNNNP